MWWLRTITVKCYCLGIDRDNLISSLCQWGVMKIEQSKQLIWCTGGYHAISAAVGVCCARAHTDTHRCTDTHRPGHTGADIHADTQIQTWGHRYTQTHKHTLTHTDINTQTQRQTQVNTQTQTHRHKQTQTQRHRHTQTHRHTGTPSYLWGSPTSPAAGLIFVFRTLRAQSHFRRKGGESH